jgi:hypothetical protein
VCPALLGLTVLVQVVRNHFWCRKRWSFFYSKIPFPHNNILY